MNMIQKIKIDGDEVFVEYLDQIPLICFWMIKNFKK